MSLRFRLNLLITVMMLFFMWAMGSLIMRETRTSIREGVEAATRVTVQLLDNVIISSYQNPELGPTHEVMQHFLNRLGRVRSLEILLHDSRGNLLYRSPPSTYRSDVVPPEWFARRVVPAPEIASRRIRFGTLTIVSEPSGAIREAWAGWRVLLALAVGMFVVLNGIVYWMLGRAFRPVDKIMGGINQLERGDLSARLPKFSLPEFNRIGQNFNRMAESLEASTEESRRLALLVKQTGDAVIIHDLDGKISFWNPAAERLFGYAAEEILGQSAALLIAPGREDELVQTLTVIRARGNVEALATQRQARDGRMLQVSLSASPLIEPHRDEVIGEICILRDMTASMRAEATERELEESRRLTQLIQRHVEEERRSLSRELHDELGQYVTAIKTFAVAIANKTRDKAPDLEAHAQTIAAAANHIYDGMHNIIRQLRPGALDNLGLLETLRDSVAGWQTQHPAVRFSLNFSGKLDSLGETYNINIYRIVQEAVTNALRYAEASEIAIGLAAQEDGTVQVTVKDNGVGMNICNVDQTTHFGLLGMRERAQSLHGSFQLDSAPGEGSCITVRIPGRQS